MSKQPRNMSPRMQWFVARIFPLPFLLGGAAMLFFGARGLLRASASKDWPTAAGKIVSSEVNHRTNRQATTTYHPRLQYTYVVDGTTHRGRRVAYGSLGSSNPSRAQRIVKKYPRGKAVTVHYMPDDPAVCLLEPGVHGQAFSQPLYGLVIIGAGVALLIFMPKLMRYLDRRGKGAKPDEPAEQAEADEDNPYATNLPPKR